ncbi:MAG: hypothetical protein HY048_05875 [Acidobacteria bacterium]|nr:hypothetical protein [Acidobacteriota bacterium]
MTLVPLARGRPTRWRIVALLLLQFAFSSHPDAQRRALFSEGEFSGAAVSRPAPDDRAVMRRRRASAALSVLAQGGTGPLNGLGALPQAARSVDLNLFDDLDVVAQLDHVETVATLGYAWVGRVAGVEGSQVILAVANGVLSGVVNVPGHMYSVRPLADGSYDIIEVDRRLIPGDANPPIPANAPARESGPPSTAAADTNNVIELLVYYTPTAKNAVGSIAAINSLLTASIAQVNSVFGASDTAARVRLLEAREYSYIETGSTATDVKNLQADIYVKADRNTVRADVVTLLVSQDSSASGAAFIGVSQGVGYPENAYSAVAYNSSLAYIYGLAHQLGHNLGCLHEPRNNAGFGGDAAGAFPYSLGYTDSVHLFHDVMSEGVDCPKCVTVDQFSSPLHSYNGFPLGIGDQDNVRTILGTTFTVANFRQHLPEISPPTNFRASVTGSRVSLTWGAPVTGRPTSYIIEAGSSAGLVNVANYDTRNLQTSLIVDGVGEDIYYIRVRATDGTVISDPSDEATLIVGRGCSFAPLPPTGLVATVSGRTISAQWTASFHALDYVGEAGTTPGGTDVRIGATGSATPAATISDVGVGTYYLRVRAKNTCGVSGPSNEVVVVVR